MFVRNVLTLIFLLPIVAQASGVGSVRFSGFGTIGAISNSTDEIGFKVDLSDPNPAFKDDVSYRSLSMIGLQLNATITNKFEAVVQFIGRDRREQGQINVVRLAALNYAPTQHWQIRLGRTSPRIFLLSDSRLIGYSNLWTMPVQEFYSSLVINYLDGFDTTYSIQKGPGTFTGNISYGQATVPINHPVYAGASLRLGRSIVVNFEYDAYDWLVRFSYAKADNWEDWPELGQVRNILRGLAAQLDWQEGFRLADDYTFEDGAVHFYSLGATYDTGNFVIKSELGRMNSNIDSVGSLDSGYLSVGYRMGDFTPYTVLAKVRTTDGYSLTEPPPAPAIPLVSLAVGTFDSRSNQTSVSLGLRWDLMLNKSLKIQWDRKSVFDNGYGLWSSPENARYPEYDVDADIISLSFDFIF